LILGNTGPSGGGQAITEYRRHDDFL
jgi:hypothetical protein